MPYFSTHRLAFGKIATFTTFKTDGDLTREEEGLPKRSDDRDNAIHIQKRQRIDSVERKVEYLAGADPPSSSSSLYASPGVQLSDVRRCRHQTSSVPPSLIELASDVLDSVMCFAMGNVTELSNACAVCSVFRCAALVVGGDENSVVWERKFSRLNPVLYKCMVAAEDRRFSWKKRCKTILNLKNNARKDVFTLNHDNGGGDKSLSSSTSSSTSSSSVSSSSSSQKEIPKVVDCLLYNHPKHGYLVNVGEARQCIFLYSLRESGDGITSLSSAGAALEAFHLPMMKRGDPAPVFTPNTDVLIVYSINGIVVAEHDDFDSFVQGIRRTSEISHWRFLHYPTCKLHTRLPEESLLGGKLRQNSSMVSEEESTIAEESLVLAETHV